MAKKINQLLLWLRECIKPAACNFMKSLLNPIWGVCVIAGFFYLLSIACPKIYKNLTFWANQPPLPTIKCKFKRLDIPELNDSIRLKDLKPYSIEIEFEDPPFQEENIAFYYNNNQLLLAKNKEGLLTGNNEEINYLIFYYKPKEKINIYGLYRGFPNLDSTSKCYFNSFIMK